MMVLETNIQTDIQIHSLLDLHKLGLLEREGFMKVNRSKIARELNCDRRTVSKYMNGFEKNHKRKRSCELDTYYDIVKDLLQSETQVFFYKRVLWQWLKDNHGLSCAQSSFRRWIQKHEEFQSYFDGTTNRTVNGEKMSCSNKHKHVLHYETNAGQEAQIDWKENMTFQLKDGSYITINIFAFVLSYSRFKIWKLSLEKTRSTLFHLLDHCFEIIGGVPKQIRCDNMKTIMDVPRTNRNQGKVNQEFQQFADEYGFEVKPCRVAEPEVKAKVESPMRILDELYAYNGKLNLMELGEMLSNLNDRVNNTLHTETGKIPVLHLEKEKDFLIALPPGKIRNLYQIKSLTVKVNSQSNITYQNAFYSVPPSYIGKQLTIQIHDEFLYVYSNMKLITVHTISHEKWNYHTEHYEELVGMSITTDKDTIKKIAKENLKKIGEKYK